jgi:hypothetical protein
MKSTGWKEAIELVGITAIVASLVFVGLELRQSREIAIAEGHLIGHNNQLERHSQINEHVSVWVKGNAGATLDDEESAIYENLLINRSSAVYSEHLRARQLDTFFGARGSLTSFSVFLYRNPGALNTWREINEDQKDPNTALGFSSPLAISWRQAVESSIAKLEDADIE